MFVFDCQEINLLIFAGQKKIISSNILSDFIFSPNYVLQRIVLLLVGKPSTPVGPLSVSDVTEKTASVSWKPPESDGGLPLTGYLLEVRDSRRTAWKKVADLKPAQTSYTVPDLDIDNEYFFRVTALNKEGAGSPLQTQEATKITKDICKYLLHLYLKNASHCSVKP